MSAAKLFVFGASGHAKVVIDILERRPDTHIVFAVDDATAKSGGMLALWFNAYFDQYLAVNRRPDEVKAAISLKPSDYWFRQCFIGASAHASRAEIDERHRLGVKNIMWGSDYPHPEGTWPASMQRTRELFTGVPEDEVALMIGGNAARVYNFDLELMNSIAAKIGPKIADISGNTRAKA